MNAKNIDIDFYNLGFKFIETKMMFVSDYKDGDWDEGKLVPFGTIEISPAACALNYGQTFFEGMKALRAKNGDITLFRPSENAKRLNKSAERLLMPKYNQNKFIDALKTVVRANEEFIPPYDSGGALYIRPLMIGNGPMLGVAPAEEFKFIIFVSPVGPYFPEGFKAIDIEISKKYTRASQGGTGFTKMGGNYAGTMRPAKEAKNKGFAQVLYLDSVHMEYINEVGAANFCAVIDGTLVTPKFTGTILEEQRDISYKELFKENCMETFCTGTAAVITPIGSITMEEKTRVFNNHEPGELTLKLYELLTGIQRLEIEDEFGWTVSI